MLKVNRYGKKGIAASTTFLKTDGWFSFTVERKVRKKGQMGDSNKKLMNHSVNVFKFFTVTDYQNRKNEINGGESFQKR